MINKLKIGLLIAVLSLFVGVDSVSAADLIWGADTTVVIDSANYTITSGSSATSVVVGATTLTVVVPDGLRFTLSSGNKYVLNTPSVSSLSRECTATTSTLTIMGPNSITITPDKNTTCTTPSGGGGGRYVPPVIPPVISPVTSGEGCSAGNIYNTSTGALCVNNASAEIPGCGNRTIGFSTASGLSCVGNKVVEFLGPPVSAYDFGTKTLKNGSRGAAVMELQRFLNAKLNLGLVVDGKLGPKTIAVIKQWQKDHGLVADGLVGAKTKAKMHTEAN